MPSVIELLNGCTTKELEIMGLNELEQMITDIKTAINNYNADTHTNHESNKKLKHLEKEMKQKRRDLQSIACDISRYFSDRKEIIANNNGLSEQLQELRMEFNEHMYKMENIQLLLQNKQSDQNEINYNTEHENKLTEMEKLRRKHNQLFTQIRDSYLPHKDQHNECEIDELLIKRNCILSQLDELQTEYNQLQNKENNENLNNRLYNELLMILESIYSMRESREKREEILNSSITNRKKQEINTEILDSQRKEQKQKLSDKLETIEQDLIEYTNLNIYTSPSVSVRNSINNVDNHSIISDSSQFDINEVKQNMNNLIQYLQDLLPLIMRKQIETLKMKINDNTQIVNHECRDLEAENILREMTISLQRKQYLNEQNERNKYNKTDREKPEITHYYLNHNMNIFDEFDNLNIKIPLIISDIPQTLLTLFERLQSLKHMNKFFAIV